MQTKYDEPYAKFIILKEYLPCNGKKETIEYHKEDDVLASALERICQNNRKKRRTDNSLTAPQQKESNRNRVKKTKKVQMP